jgi:hypothetical protein
MTYEDDLTQIEFVYVYNKYGQYGVGNQRNYIIIFANKSYNHLRKKTDQYSR